MAKRGFYNIIVLGNRCKECGLCINICPTKVLEVGDKPNLKGYLATKPAHPEKCIGCRLCEYICPDYVLVIKESDSGKSIGRIIWDGGEDIYEG